VSGCMCVRVCVCAYVCVGVCGMQVPENATIVEIVLNNFSPTAHVIHLHGQKFKVINFANYDWCHVHTTTCWFSFLFVCLFFYLLFSFNICIYIFVAFFFSSSFICPIL
jgi:hypothetical protein